MFREEPLERDLHLSGIRIGVLFVLQESHGILYDDFILEASELYDFRRYPGSDDGHVHFPRIDLLFELDREFHRFHELELFVGEAPVLLGGCAFEETCISHGDLRLWMVVAEKQEIGRAHV